MDQARKVGIEKAHNFMRQYRDNESRELKKLSANQFMDVWSHYDEDGEFMHKINIKQFIFFDVNFVNWYNANMTIYASDVIKFPRISLVEH